MEDVGTSHCARPLDPRSALVLALTDTIQLAPTGQTVRRSIIVLPATAVAEATPPVFTLGLKATHANVILGIFL
jgi:hypothetical protein